jgi:hypothetical protein
VLDPGDSKVLTQQGVMPLIETSPRSVAQAMTRCGLCVNDFPDVDVELAAGEDATWPDSHGSWERAQAWLTTPNLNVYRRWMWSPQGVPVALEDGLPDARDPRFQVPQLAPDDHAQLASVARSFVFGSCARLLPHQDLIEHHFGPFVANAVVLRRLELGRGARLLLKGSPFVLLVDVLVMHQDSQLLVEHLSHVSVGRVSRLP